MSPAQRIVTPLLLALSLQATAQEQRIESPAQRVSLVELYTSEGCSSCPPADRWMSGLKDDPGLWQRVVPVSFHVDYWDYIGWPDRFASPEFGARQRSYARSGNLASVYTPGFVVHGEEWRGWFRHPALELDHPPPAGVIRLDIAPDRRHLDARYTAAAASPQPLDLHLAVLGFGLETPVKAGENEGRTLKHDFVVLGYSRVPLNGDSPAFTASAEIPEAREQAPRTALAAWVSRRGDPAPLQAAGGWLQ